MRWVRCQYTGKARLLQRCTWPALLFKVAESKEHCAARNAIIRCFSDPEALRYRLVSMSISDSGGRCPIRKSRRRSVAE